MNLVESQYGLEIDSTSFTVFFGNKEVTIQKLKEIYPQYDIKTLHQTHGDKCVEMTPIEKTEPQADASYTTHQKIALVIKTADCIPIFVYDPIHKKIGAIHAGWGGIQKNIFPKLITQEFKNNVLNLKVFVGPHILWTSFEVDHDVKNQLTQDYDIDELELVVKNKQNNKFNINLFELLRLQIFSTHIPINQTFAYLKDTATDVSLNSFRRDRNSSGRNLSFIALK